MNHDHTPPAPPPEEPAAGPTPAPFPWPPPAEAGLGGSAEALAETWRRSVLHPVSFFRAMPADGVGPAVVYFLIIGIAAAGLALFWSSVLAAAFPQQPDWLRALGYDTGGTEAVVGFLLSPLLLLLGLVVSSAIAHALLLLVGASAGGFAATLRVFCYSVGPQLFVIVPVLGDVVAAIWALVLTVVGLRQVHGASTARVVVAIVVLPLVALLMLALIFGLAVVLLGLELRP